MAKVSADPARRGSGARLSIDDWIELGLALLAEEGVSAIKIDRLCARMGVTKGSFYWHFTDLDALLDAVAERYGSGHDTTRQRLHELVDVEPHERLVETLIAFMANDLGRLDSAMRTWAQTDERARLAVSASDEYIFGYVDQAFRDMGFSPEEADLRAKTLYYTGIGFSVVGPLGRRGSERQLRALEALLTR